MNALLKPAVKLCVDIAQGVEAGAKKDLAGVLKEALEAGMDLPALVQNWSDLEPELKALVSDPSADADLLAYAASLLAGEDAKAQAVVLASADLLLALVPKIGALVAAAALPTPVSAA